jgi:hypothetical protein
MTPTTKERAHDAAREALLSFQPVGRQFIAYSGLASLPMVPFKSGRTVADVVPDERYPGMYRVKLAGEPPTDMVNLTRARDVAIALVGRAVVNEAAAARRMTGWTLRQVPHPRTRHWPQDGDGPRSRCAGSWRAFCGRGARCRSAP